MFNKPTTLLAFICLVILFCVFLTLFFLNRIGAGSTDTFTSLPTSSDSTGTNQSNVSSGEKFVEIEIADGKKIYFIDPRSRAETTKIGDDLYQMTSLDNVSDTSFGVTFNAKDGSFAVGLEEEPLGSTRSSAEEYLRNSLQLSNAELCLMQIFVGTTAKINSFYSGKNLGLSFCKGSVKLD